jgi:hypothetical protein
MPVKAGLYDLLLLRRETRTLASLCFLEHCRTSPGNSPRPRATALTKAFPSSHSRPACRHLCSERLSCYSIGSSESHEGSSDAYGLSGVRPASAATCCPPLPRCARHRSSLSRCVQSERGADRQGECTSVSSGIADAVLLVRGRGARSELRDCPGTDFDGWLQGSLR